MHAGQAAAPGQCLGSMRAHETASSSTARRSSSRRAAALGRRPGRAVAVSVSAALVARGKAISADQINVKRLLGEGSYGQVFDGVLLAGGSEERVVLKRVKARVEVRGWRCGGAGVHLQGPRHIHWQQQQRQQQAAAAATAAKQCTRRHHAPPLRRCLHCTVDNRAPAPRALLRWVQRCRIARCAACYCTTRACETALHARMHAP